MENSTNKEKSIEYLPTENIIGGYSDVKPFSNPFTSNYPDYTSFSRINTDFSPSYVRSMRGKSENESSLASALEEAIEPYLGIPYKWGSKDPSKALDCSGFVNAVLNNMGYSYDINTFNSQRMWNELQHVKLRDAKVGDLVILKGTAPGKRNPDEPSHVAIITDTSRLSEGILGVAEASSSKGTKYSTWDLNKYYKNLFMGVVRPGGTIQQSKKGGFIPKHQKGKTIANVMAPLIENTLDSRFFSLGSKLAAQKAEALKPGISLLSNIANQYGSKVVTPEERDAIFDFTNYVLNKDRFNIVWDPSKGFSWEELPLAEAQKTYSGLPVMFEEGEAAFPLNLLIQKGMSRKMIHNNGILIRQFYPNQFIGYDKEHPFPIETFNWEFVPSTSPERAFITTTKSLDIPIGDKTIITNGHLMNLGIVPARQTVDAQKMQSIYGDQLNTLSREGKVSLIKTFKELAKPYSIYASGDFVRGFSMSPQPSTTPIGSHLMGLYDSGIISPDDYMTALFSKATNKERWKVLDDSSSLSTDSFKLVGNMGEKGNNKLRWGGWDFEFNPLGTTNKELMELQDAYKAKLISPEEYKNKVTEWIFSNFKSVSDWNPEDLVKPNTYNSKDIMIRHPFVLPGKKRGGILKRIK